MPDDSETTWPPRQPLRNLDGIRRVVLKLGSSTLANSDLNALASALVALRAQGVEVALVTSGAVAFGMQQMGIDTRPSSLPRVQALAAVGQVDLMARYRAALAPHGVTCAQVLLTHEALADRGHFLNVRRTMDALFAFGVLPIANENDTVATEELRFGDNDRLAAALATVIDADLVILLSDIDALYDADPRESPGARPIHEVAVIDATLRAAAGRRGSEIGTGGMHSKLEAAQIAVEAGIPLIIAAGDDPGLLARLLAGERIGTWFAPAKRLDRRRHWIGFLSKLTGTLKIDAGAVRALREGGGSLLPIGVTGIDGRFERGDGVAIAGPRGETVARGLVGYDTDTLQRILGLRSEAVADLLELSAVDPVVHRNDMVLDPIEPA